METEDDSVVTFGPMAAPAFIQQAEHLPQPGLRVSPPSLAAQRPGQLLARAQRVEAYGPVFRQQLAGQDALESLLCLG